MNRLSTRSRILVALGALLLLGMFATPLWRINLLAPQYPEGLGMLIRLKTITGIKPADLDNINGLNHYIGMKRIDPDAIPVLSYMPWVVGALVAFGLGAALIGRRALVWAWLCAFGVAGLAGLAEFYRWSYDYGHNLAEDAVIKVPGMTYQPPLIGVKQLLNFRAASFPDVGSYLALAAFALGIVALAPRFRDTGRTAKSVLALLFLGGLFGCAMSGPVPIEYGRADCAQCRMRITDQRFGGEVISTTGKVQQFDAVECMAEYLATASAKPRLVLVTDFQRPGTLIHADEARYLIRSDVRGDMGAGVIAVKVGDTAIARSRFGVGSVTWDSVTVLAKRSMLSETKLASRVQ